MGYYTRVLTRRSACPSLSELTRVLAEENLGGLLSGDEEDSADWTNLSLSHAHDECIASIERNVVAPGTLGAAEVAELVDHLNHCKPTSAAAWLRDYLPSVRTIYAFQHLSGTDTMQGDEMLRAVRNHIWSLGDAIVQADGEGFSNEDGYHILWQFHDSVKGPWHMAVLRDGHWVRFEMNLGSRSQRKAFLAGEVPRGARLA